MKFTLLNADGTQVAPSGGFTLPEGAGFSAVALGESTPSIGRLETVRGPDGVTILTVSLTAEEAATERGREVVALMNAAAAANDSNPSPA